MRYATAQARREWNALAKPGHKITTESGYRALKEECQCRHRETGNREIEMPAHAARSGHAELIRF